MSERPQATGDRLRVVVLCPGRGSYTASDLGYLRRPAPPAARERLLEVVHRVDDARIRRGDPGIREMDDAERFSSRFLLGENASPLTFACTAFDFLRLDRDRARVVAVGGNSLGWYSALFCGGVFGLEETFRLVETMGGMARDGIVGGQIVYPVVGDDWRRDADRERAVAEALAAAADAGHAAGHSIRFGGYEVLWGDDAGVELLMERLPSLQAGSRSYPFRLHGHSAFHSPLMEGFSHRGREALQDEVWMEPEVPLVDGRGAQWRPLTTDPWELFDYTLGHQVVRTFDFGATVRVALREYAPDAIVLLGPGDSLGGAVAQVVIEERWQGIDDRESFLARQADDPFLLSMARPEQAERVLARAPAS